MRNKTKLFFDDIDDDDDDDIEDDGDIDDNGDRRGTCSSLPGPPTQAVPSIGVESVPHWDQRYNNYSLCLCLCVMMLHLGLSVPGQPDVATLSPPIDHQSIEIIVSKTHFSSWSISRQPS